MNELNELLYKLRLDEAEQKYGIEIALKSSEYSHLRSCAEKLEIIGFDIQNTINEMVDMELERQKQQQLGETK